MLNDSTVIITDMETGNQKRVSKDRIKLFDESKFVHYKNFINEKSYDKYHTELKKQLYKLGTKPRTEKPSKELDFDQIRGKL